MGPGRICILVLCILLYFQDTLQAKAQKCRRTNKKPFRYCLDRQCTSDSDCRANHQCLCDGDCGLSCVQNGTDCGKPDTPKALRVRLSEGTKFGSVARFSCKGDQYTLRGSKKRVCRGIGKWDGKDAKCRILCKHPGDIAYGNNNGDKKNYRVGATVRYWCFPGYDMEGQSVTECNNKGKWKTPPPKCEAPSCSKPIPPDNAFIYSRQKLKEKYKYNEVVRFRCEHGHYTSGSSFQRCLASGWSNSDFRCIPKSCGDPGSPVNGKRQGYVFTFKRKVYFKCNRGYKLDGPEYRQCQANQKWSDRTPSCEPINCGRLEEPDDGEKIEETSTFFGGKVVFDCKKIGFEMKGSKQRFCQEDGQWSGTNTTCERVECKDLGTPGNGVRKPDKNKYVYEDKIEFRCNTNYTFIGRQFVICQSDRTWSGAVPRCLAPCRDPGIPIGGHRYQHSFLHNKIVQFSCNSGWTMDGSRTIRCTDGRWDHDSPTCNKACLRPNKYPVNGGIRGSYISYRHKYSIRYYCNRGYNLVGQEYVRCLNGTWENKQPTCRPVECRDPGKLVNGGRYPDKSKYVFKDSIRFQCKTNYTLRGVPAITCQHDKRWSGNVPRCLAPCRDPGIPNNGQRYDHSFLHYARVRFSCRRGWNIEGSQTITCNDGNWDHTTPECMEGCQRPKRPDNGGIYREKVFYRHRERIRYYCNYGYQRLGTQYSACEKGRWKQQTPTCKRKCGNPGRPDNGDLTGSDLYEGREIRFYCNRGFDLIGSQTTRCLATGRWSEPRPACKRGCYSPRFSNSIPNPSLRQGQKTLHGTNITFSCSQQSYTLDGPSVIYCLNGRWNYNVPVCRASCLKPGNLPNGQKAGDNYAHGQKVTYTCLGLYTLVGSSSMRCNDGKWILEAQHNQWPSCKKPCTNPGTPNNGSKTGSDYRHGRQVFYSCERGTYMVGERSSTCYDGKWSNVLPACLKICQDPEAIVNGYKTENPRLYLAGDRVTYRCNSGYDLVGRAELVCKDDGQWNDNVPICYGRCKVPSGFTGVQSQPSVKANEYQSHKKVISFYCTKDKQLVGPKKIVCEDGLWNKRFPTCQVPCKNPGKIKNGKSKNTNFTAKYKCDQGYSLVGSSFINCVEGKWKPSPPRCLKDCDDPGQPIDGTKNSTDYRHGKVVSFQCLKGFRLEGSTAITCSNGTWSSRKTRCIGVCPHLDAPKNGKRLDNNFDHESRVYFQCDQGYSMQGSLVLICNTNGKWSREPPVCRAPCPNPGPPTNGRRKENNFGHGAAVQFFCDPGYELFGAQTLTCNDGSWSHAVPTCETGCSNLKIPKGMTTQGNLDRSRTSISFSCTLPLVLVGKSVLTCINGRWSDILPVCSECGSALGMENGKIPDSNIRASSTRYRYHAKYGRLNGRYAWCSGTELDPYLQIDFGKPYRITGLATQGSAYDNKWVETYTVRSNLAGSSFNIYREDGRDKIFIGNRDNGSVVRNKLKNPVIARRLRILPKKQGGFSYYNPACVRVEIYGCDLPSDCILIGSRVVAKWGDHVSGGYKYFKAYLTNMGSYWKVEWEEEFHGRNWYKNLLNYEDLPFVLDVPPKHEELQVGTRVLAPWGHTYYTSTIKTGRDRYNRYRVRADDGDERYFTIDQIRVLKAPTFCVKCLMTSLLVSLCFLFSSSKLKDYDHCGLHSVNMDIRNRILGGIQSHPGMWPWQVAIYKGGDDGKNEKRFICGGALVDTKWVITTAHCFFKMSESSSRIRYVNDSSSPNKYHVIAGDYNIFRKEKNEQVRQVRAIRIFPGYRHAPFYENDIALIELNETVTLSPVVRTICIPDSNEKVSVPGTVARVAGWGRTTKSIRSPVLRHSAYQIQNDDLCDQATDYFFNRSVTFCAGSGKGGNDTCQGDSGGSMVRQVLHKGAQRWVTVGLVSWGEGCGIQGKYGYYTRMEPFVPWIQKTIKPEVSCGKPSKIRNGRFTGKDFFEGSRVKYKCKRGYKLKGRSRRKCKQNGQWSKAPVCQKVQCPRLNSPINGSRKPAKRKYFYRDKIRFSCKTNFTRIGKPVIVCQHDTTWSGFQAFCLAPCPDPGIPKGGSRLDHSFRHNDLVRFSCNGGRKMEGVRAIRCSKGRWNQSPPKCIEICAQPRTPVNGNIHMATRKSIYDNKDRVRFFCNIGYRLDGHEYGVCVNGKWNKDPPTCKRICRNPGRPANGGFKGSEFIEGREMSFFCNAGFDLLGLHTIMCLPTGRWSGPRPECKRRCNNPVIQSNGPTSNPRLVRGHKTKHGTTISFTCRSRYTLLGKKNVRCDDGRWSDNIPSCKGGCEVPDNFTGVHSSPLVLPGQIIQHSSRITFSCLYNKTLKGFKETVCDNGEWSALFPKCEASKTHCPDPGVPQNGYITSLPTVDFPQGTTITFACNDTYTSQGHQTIECQNGNWSHEIPKCLAPCKDPGVPKDGIRYDHAFQHGDKVRFACKSGKTIKGEAVIRCNNGKWNHNPPECMVYGNLSEVLYNNGIEFKCRDGFQKVGMRNMSCGDESSNSSFQVPVCKPLCPNPGVPADGNIIKPSMPIGKHGSRVTFHCNDKYVLQGQHTLECQGGRWSGEIPKCLAPCKAPGIPYGGIKHGTSYKHSEQVRFRCKEGMVLHGAETLTCNNGAWDHDTPKCLTRCLNPGVPKNGYPEKPMMRFARAFKHGTVMTFMCNDTYTLEGQQAIECVDGRWSHEIPKCFASCKDPGTPDGGIRYDSTFQHNDRVRFACNSGKTMEGSESITCKDGRWSGKPPKCI
ncbi:sushi, von Willebrand factor type A, EGF and pentraxin domain-containing protein 1-like, partial [Actinia tenebrosa]|uniref:Sushi, von Willebrand factor type A, EGF and pentraxin domain-containing protein 1-like n=1 Tax=Actinia tenebrosa TaxID=6105 RepID=A0A6P8H3J4_ACTTE